MRPEEEKEKIKRGKDAPGRDLYSLSGSVLF